MAPLTQSPTMGDVLKYSENPNYTNETVTLLTGTNYAVGSVLGQITTAGATSVANGGNTGNGVLTVDAVDPVLADAQAGAYKVTIITAATNGGTYTVTGPNGNPLGNANVAATFANEIKFVLADGATDFVVGDFFTITVAAGSGKYKLATADGTDGAQIASAVLLMAADATAADATGVILARGPAIVSKAALVFDATVTAGALTTTKYAELTAVGIVPRTSA